MPRNELLQKRGLRTAGVPCPIRSGCYFERGKVIPDLARGMVGHNCITLANERYIDGCAQLPEWSTALERIFTRDRYYSEDCRFFIETAAQVPFGEILDPMISTTSEMRKRALWVNDVEYSGDIYGPDARAAHGNEPRAKHARKDRTVA